MLKDRQAALGAVFGPFLGSETALEYAAGYAAEYEAAKSACGLLDRSAYGRIELFGADRSEFLHRMSTNDVRVLKSGDALLTVLTTPEAKIIDLLSVYAKPDSLLCVTSPQHAATVLGWFKRNIFFRDKVKPVDQSAHTAQLTLFGPKAGELLRTVFGIDLDSVSGFHWESEGLEDHAVLAARLPATAGGGVDLIADSAHVEALWDALLAAGKPYGLLPLGTKAYDALRIEAGVPLYGAELSADVNPLEAGLMHAISFSKGCYTGQEIIARLDTYQKLKQTLVRLCLAQLPDAPLPLTLRAGGAEIGRVTSVARLPVGDVLGLGYVRMKAYEPGKQAELDDAGRPIVATIMPLMDTTVATAA